MTLENHVTARIRTTLETPSGEDPKNTIACLREELEDKGWDVISIEVNEPDVPMELDA